MRSVGEIASALGRRRRRYTALARLALERRAVGGGAPSRLLRRLIEPELLRLVERHENCVLTEYDDRHVIAVTHHGASPWRLAARAADQVSGALTEAGSPFFAVHLPGTRVTRWAVRRSDLPRINSVLRETLGEQGFYLAPQGSTDRPRLVLEGLSRDEMDSISTVTLFQYVRCGATKRLYGAPDGCELTVWDENEAGALASHNRDDVVQEIESFEGLDIVVRDRWDGRPEPRLAAADSEAFAIDFPVDAVYLWVDDSDPRWREKRDDVRRRLGMPPAPTSTDESLASHRFRDRGELRASLRSLEMYAPWIRNVYLVTDEQRPDWLDAEHGRVKVIDHREIFSDPSVLPSYNSHAISSQIHRIPGLSDHYLLMNDDVMFSRPVTPYNFFTSVGQLRINFSRSRRPDTPRSVQSSLELARSNSAALLERDHGRRASSLFGHVPVPQRKDVALEIERRYAEEIRRTIESPFRAATDVVVSSWLHLYTALFTGRGVRAGIRFGYFNIGSAATREKMENLSRIRTFQVICLNDVPPPGGEDEADPAWLAQWLEKMFPVPAGFERSATDAGRSESALTTPGGRAR